MISNLCIEKTALIVEGYVPGMQQTTIGCEKSSWVFQ
jgi:hypothetical protein